MGFNRPSKIQETALPMLLSRQPQNLIAQGRSRNGVPEVSPKFSDGIRPFKVTVSITIIQ